MKTKRTGFLTKLVVLVVLVAISISLLDLRGRLSQAEADRDALQAAVDTQTQYNAALSDDIANSSDPQRTLEIAKERLGLVEQGEVVFYDTTN